MPRLIRSVSLLLVLGALAAAQSTIPLFQPGKIRALIFSGRNNHDWRSSTPYLKKLLVGSGRFDVRVVEEPDGATAETLAAYEVLILDYNGPRWGAAAENAVGEFVRSGKGLVVVHGDSWAFNGLPVLGDRHTPTKILEPAWPEYGDMIGGVWSLEEPRTGHGELHSFKVQFIDPNHPIAKGMDETFLATDELYHHMRMRPGAKVLAAAFDDPKMKGTGKEEPVLWTVDFGKGRVFHTTLGHDLAAMMEPGFILTFLRGAEWAATGKVTLPAKLDPVQSRLEKIKTRILVVTGGHSYDTSFYTMFEGYDDLHWDHALSNHEAYKEDLRPNYDVLVLYDFVQDITEAEKKVLVDFVEGGKGLVVLHHAIADYQHWPWWYETVVGGRYVLKPESGHPESKYKHDEEMFVYPAGKHSITTGINRMHIWDETYKDLWISPKVQVLLKTDNPTSDGPVAWVSPYDKSRVVYIQLGHDRLAHVHPGYRALVRSAIQWARGASTP